MNKQAHKITARSTLTLKPHRGQALAALIAALTLMGAAPAAQADGPERAYAQSEPPADASGFSENEQYGLVNADGVHEDPQHPMSTTARAFRNGIIAGRSMQQVEDDKKSVNLPPLPPGMPGTKQAAAYQRPSTQPHVRGGDDTSKRAAIPTLPADDTAVVQPVPSIVPTEVRSTSVAPVAATAVAENPPPVSAEYVPQMTPGSSYTRTVTRSYVQTTTSYSAPAEPIQAAQPIYNAPVQQVYQAPPPPAPAYVQPALYAPQAVAPAQYVYVIQPAPQPMPAGYGPRAFAPRYVMAPQPRYYTRGYW
jgi:hypothetical protein